MTGVYRDPADTMLAPGTRRAVVDVGVAAQLACLLEVSAPKPGNVSPGRHFADLRYEELLASAVAIGAPLSGAGTRGIGATVRLSVEAASPWTQSNSNLGIVLLFAPLARAVLTDPAPVHGQAGVGLHDRVRWALESTTVADAREAYAAIRLAAPGGLGRADSQDVAGEPTKTLVEVMRLASDRDTIASEYATGYTVTFGTAVPALERARRDRLDWDDAVVETFLTVLASRPDTHIARRNGTTFAAEVTRRATSVLAAGGVRTAAGRTAIDAMDRDLRDERNRGNPGTTADLTAAAIFVVLLGGGWLPQSGGGGVHAATR